LIVTRVSLLVHALGAQALALYIVSGIYSVVYHDKAIIDTLQYVTTAYFLPGAILALLVGILAKRTPGESPKEVAHSSKVAQS
jgi:MFS family permease